MDKRKNNGGKRIGAGRPPSEKKIKRNTSVPEKLLKSLMKKHTAKELNVKIIEFLIELNKKKIEIN